MAITENQASNKKFRLTATGRSVEEDATGGLHSELEELLRVLDRVLDQFLKLSLDAFQATDVLPGDGRDLDDRLPDGRRGRLAHREAEVLHRDGEAVENLGVDGLVLQVDEVHLFADLLKGSLGAEGREIGTDVAVSFGGNLRKKQK